MKVPSDERDKAGKWGFVFNTMNWEMNELFFMFFNNTFYFVFILYATYIRTF